MQNAKTMNEDRRCDGEKSSNLTVNIPDTAFYRAAAKAADAGIVVQAMDGVVLWANDAYMRMMALPADQIIGKNPLSYALPPEQQMTASEIAAFKHQVPPDNQPQISIFQNIRGTGERFWIELHVSFDSLRGFGPVAIMVARDITDHISRQQELSATSVKLSHLAATDSLTGLSNRLDILDRIKQALVHQKRRGGLIGLLEIDLDHFKTINDTLGHSAGDAVLCKLADALRDTISENDVAARVGGDEFLVLCPNIDSLESIVELGQRVIAKNQSTVMVDGVNLRCDLSIGAAVTTSEDISPEDLLKRADFALYEAKERGRDCVVAYDSALHLRHTEEARLAEELFEAVQNKELTFHFQPTMFLQSGEIRGFEALIRWHNPRLGWMSPADFLPLGKSRGLMSAIDFAAMEAALDLKQELNRHGHTKIRVGLNGSAELLGHPAFFDTLMEGLQQRELTPHCIVIEVLETVVFDDVSTSNPLVLIIQKLHDAGIATLLDDFGTGHAGLTHLATLAVSGVKIDRTLTRNILSDPTCAKIISIMYELCLDLDLYTVTEGIETRAQAQAAYDLGGQVIQGFWLSQAMPAEDIIAWLANRENIADQIDRSSIADAPTERY